MRVRTRRLLACASAAAVTATLAVLASPGTPTASASHATDRTHHRAKVKTAKAKTVKVDPRLFGVHDDHATSLHRSGTGAIRLWDSGTQWKDIFPTADSTGSWGTLDSLVTQAHANGTEVTLVLGLTPSYAVQPPTDPTDPTPPPTSAPDPEKYAAYVRAVMERYSPANWQDASGHHYRGIAAYQVWNESNIATFWTGTYGELGDLVKRVHDIRDQVDPGAKVVAPAMVTRLGYQQKGIKKFYKIRVDGKPVWKYVDALSFNLYPLDRYPNPNPTRMGTPEDSMALLSTVKKILGRDHVSASIPIWNTEINYGMRFGANGGKAAARIPAARQVAYVIRTYLLNAARGVKRVDWYAYDMNTRDGRGPLGNTLLTDPSRPDDGVRTAAGRAFTRVQGWMKGTLVGTTTKRPCIRDRHGTYTCTIRYAHGKGRVYWNPYHRAEVRLVASASRKVNEYGVGSRARGGSRLKVDYRPVLVRSAH
jgi:hypothetical protein